jgi:hypothetical protein
MALMLCGHLRHCMGVDLMAILRIRQHRGLMAAWVEFHHMQLTPLGIRITITIGEWTLGATSSHHTQVHHHHSRWVQDITLNSAEICIRSINRGTIWMAVALLVLAIIMGRLEEAISYLTMAAGKETGLHRIPEPSHLVDKTRGWLGRTGIRGSRAWMTGEDVAATAARTALAMMSVRLGDRVACQG